MIEILALFISKHAAFLEAYGNLLLIPLIILMYFADYLIRKRSAVQNSIKWALRTLIFILNILVGTILFMINFPLKPMVNSLAKVQRNIGHHLDDFTFTSLSDKKHHSLAEYKGKLVVVNFWATYCGPCLEEFPELIKLEKAYSGRIEVIVLSDEDPKQILRIVQKLNVPSGIGFYSNEKWMNLESFRPVTVILDTEGIIREYKFGRNSYSEFKNMVDRYL
jgi:thiol-disulfide isomerase/thioredoxin